MSEVMRNVITSRPGEAEELSSATSARHIRIDLGELHITEYRNRPGKAGGFHTHQKHVDAYVLEGEAEFPSPDGAPIRVGPGTLVAVPPCVVHAFPAILEPGARFLDIHAPGVNVARYIRELIALKGAPTPRELLERFDIHDTPKP